MPFKECPFFEANKKGVRLSFKKADLVVLFRKILSL